MMEAAAITITSAEVEESGLSPPLAAAGNPKGAFMPAATGENTLSRAVPPYVSHLSCIQQQMRSVGNSMDLKIASGQGKGAYIW
jgi:hypothetical protein